jgi:hypothetical protein
MQAIKILGGSKETAMQSLQLHLIGVARSWLSKLARETIRSCDKITKQVTGNFCSTYKRPASIEEVKACVQKSGESLHSYIQRWSLIKNSTEDVFDEQAIDTFSVRLCHSDLIEDVTNKFADREDAYYNKRTRSPEDDRSHRYNNQRRRSHNYDNYGSQS